MYINPSFRHSSKLKKIDLLLNDISSLLGSPIFFVGDENNGFLKQNSFCSKDSILFRYNGMTQQLTTATRNTIESATLIDHGFHNHFSDYPDSGILDAGLPCHCATFVNLPFSFKEYDDTRTTFRVFPFI